MGRLLRGMGAFVVCLWILYGLERYHIPINTSGMLVLIILIIYTIVFPGGKKSTGATTGIITQERIINLQDDSLGDVFIPSYYPPYSSLLESIFSNKQNCPDVVTDEERC